jgi:hypothetical protein
MNNRLALFLSVFLCLFFPLQALIHVSEEFITKIDREKAYQYSKQVIVLDAYGYVKSVYKLEKNRLVRALTPKKIEPEELENSLILQNTPQVPEQCVTISYHDALEKRYWLSNGTLRQEVIPAPSFFTSEKELFTRSKDSDIRIISCWNQKEENESSLFVMNNNYHQLLEQSTIRSLIDTKKLIFADQETQKQVSAWAKEAGVKRPVAAYEYTFSESNEYEGFRATLSWNCDQRKKIQSYGDTYLILLQKNTDPSLKKAVVLHELGHFTGRDIEQHMRLAESNPSWWQEREFAADEIAYTLLSLENNRKALVHYYLYLCSNIWRERIDDLLSSKNIYSQKYKQSNPTDSHPASWQRARRCLEALEKTVTQTEISLTEYLNTYLKKECGTAIAEQFLVTFTQLFPERASKKQHKEYKKRALASGKAGAVSVVIETTEKDSTEILEGCLFLKEYYPELIQEDNGTYTVFIPHYFDH